MAIDSLYTRRQQEVLHYATTHDYFMLINHGAKRSGKTILDNDLFLVELRRARAIADEDGVILPQYILAGADLSSIRRNVLTELSNKYGIQIRFDRSNRFQLLGVSVCCFGHSKLPDMARIRGMTAYGAYINEASMANREVFAEIIARCSTRGARVIMDTNPDRPSHWLKKDYIDKADQQTIAQFPWKLDDNTFLPQQYRANMKHAVPPGAFYDRDINGLWVSPEGLVYPEFAHWVETRPARLVSVFAGLDFGWEHPGALVVVGMDSRDTFYILEAISAQHKGTDEWIVELATVRERYGEMPVYCDSARPDLIDEVARHGYDARNAKKDVLLGIGYVASLIHADRLYACLDGVGDDFRREIESYSWHPDADAPIKIDDDIMDAMRYALYSHSIYENEVVRAVTRPILRGGVL